MTDFFEIGTILKPQGIKGEVKVEPYTDDINRLAKLKTLFFKKGDEYTAEPLDSVRVDGKYAYIKFKDVDDRNKAEELRGKKLFIDRENAQRLPEGSYYIADLLGMDVFDDTGESYGKLKDIMQTGSKDIYVIALFKGGTLSFPSVEGVIINRDIKAQKMIIDSHRIGEVGIYDI